MQANSLAEKILITTEQEVKKIQEETLQIVEELKKEELSKIQKRYNDVMNERKQHFDSNIKTFKKQMDNELIAYERQAKQMVIFDLFNKIFERISKLEKDELRNFIVKLLKDQDIKGTETMVVSKKDYQRFLVALSSNGNNTLDLLTKANKTYQFKLEVGNINFESGFLLVDKDYDLIFDFKEIVDRYQEQMEKQVYKELFDNEWYIYFR